MSTRPRPGSPEWRAKFDRDREQFDRMWPWAMALSAVAAVTVLVLVAVGVIPWWVLFL